MNRDTKGMTDVELATLGARVCKFIEQCDTIGNSFKVLIAATVIYITNHLETAEDRDTAINYLIEALETFKSIKNGGQQ